MMRLNKPHVVMPLLTALLFLSSASSAKPKVAIEYNEDDTLMAFAVGDIREALQQTGYKVQSTHTDFHIIFEKYEAGMGPQAFRIRREADRTIRVVGGDSLGAMYGGLELAEMITLGGGLDAVQEKARKPYIFRRGLKFNIPLDARSSSYDDTGTAAQENIPVMWEFDFWQRFLDTMARNRYNVLTLWTKHPYPGLVKLEKYPGVGYNDVCVLKETIDTKTNLHFDDLDIYNPDNFKVVKKISLDDKIAFWTKVFDYAEERGIEIYIFHWNIYTFGAKGKYGITDDIRNAKTIDYMRYCIGEFLRTYPQVDGIGVTAGEHVVGSRESEMGIEQWMWHTYGQGVMDAKIENPQRDIRFIFRQHMASLGKINDAFKAYEGPFNTGHKYARARLYSTTTSPYLDIEYRQELERHKVPCWLNLRNDDIFVHRWGDADYVREFLQNVPRDLMRWEAGFYMGPDGYVWGREFISKDPALSGELEVNKHWYRFMLWGRLAYDLTLTRDYFEKRLENRFPQAEAALLYDTWAAASQIIPQVNRFFFRVNDFQFSPEGCISNEGFLTVDNSFFAHPPLRGSGILSVQQYASAVIKGESLDGITPIEVADNLDKLAEKALAGIKTLSNISTPSKELAATLTDMESMAYLGRYYADKIRGAADLAVFRADPGAGSAAGRGAVRHLTNAVKEWEAYARVATSQYRPQLFSRTNYMDWWRLLEEVKKEAETVRTSINSDEKNSQ